VSEGPEDGRVSGEDGYVWHPPTGTKARRGRGRNRPSEPAPERGQMVPPPAPATDPSDVDVPRSDVPGADAPAVDDTDAAGAGSSTVRPYFYTRGRTRSAVELEIETMLSAVRDAGPPPGPAVAAWELCHETRSVAEVAALMRVPLGVARVLLGDLAAAGSVVVHQTVDAEGPALTLLQRVLSGLRNL
jgi:Protein of unknown function (DUF742)